MVKRLLPEGMNGQSSEAKAPETLRDTKIVKVKEQNAIQAVQKEHNILEIEAKKKKVEHKKAAKTSLDQGQLVQQPPVPLTLKEYMSGEWFRMVEEKEEEEVLGRMIIVDVDFQGRDIEIMQENCTRSIMTISSYNQVENRGFWSKDKGSRLEK